MTGVIVGFAVLVGVLVTVAVNATEVVVGVAVGVDVVEGDGPDVVVAVLVSVGDGSAPLNGVSVTYTGPAGDPPNRRSPGCRRPAPSR